MLLQRLFSSVQFGENSDRSDTSSFFRYTIAGYLVERLPLSTRYFISAWVKVSQSSNVDFKEGYFNDA